MGVCISLKTYAIDAVKSDQVNTQTVSRPGGTRWPSSYCPNCFYLTSRSVDRAIFLQPPPFPVSFDLTVYNAPCTLTRISHFAVSLVLMRHLLRPTFLSLIRLLRHRLLDNGSNYLCTMHVWSYLSNDQQQKRYALRKDT